MKVFARLFSALIIATSLLGINVSATSTTTYVNLEKLKYSNNQTTNHDITEYTTLTDFLVDYHANNLPDIYLTNFLFDGVSAVKTPDLDDFIENSSNDTKIEDLKIKVININAVGSYEFTGNITGAMLAINTNDKSGNINIVLNNASIDTDSKKAPAIYVYNKDKNYTDCIVTIKTMSRTKNYLEGGKLKKVSLIGSDELDEYNSYYSGDSLANYTNYPAYYGVYTSDEINNIIFATVKADSEDLQDGDPYYFYKASGAVSSDIDLYFEGEGYLKVTSKNKEGIETKGNLTFSGGTGDYEIFAEDDCLNTTTANNSATTVRNDLTINVGSLLATVSTEADEGDAIDSNGKLVIDGGTIYAFANPNSGDAGLDSVNGIYINGGTVIATGNMVDQISDESKQNFIYASFNKISADTLITIKDQDDAIITAFKTGRNIQNLVYSSPNLNYESYKLYTGGTIEGEETNGLYVVIDSYTGGEEIAFNNSSSKRLSSDQNSISNVAFVALITEIALLSIALVFYCKKY